MSRWLPFILALPVSAALAHSPAPTVVFTVATKLTTLTNWLNSSSPEVTAWNYEAASGRLQSLVYPDSSSGSGGPGLTNTYTAGGRLLTRKTGRGITTTLAYTRAGELFSALFSDGTPGITNGYDRRGRLVSILHTNQTITRAYDDAGEVLSK